MWPPKIRLCSGIEEHKKYPAIHLFYFCTFKEHLPGASTCSNISYLNFPDSHRLGAGRTHAVGLQGNGERTIRPLLYEDVQENCFPHRQFPESCK